MDFLVLCFWLGFVYIDLDARTCKNISRVILNRINLTSISDSRVFLSSFFQRVILDP
jgi:hypothetical protein